MWVSYELFVSEGFNGISYATHTFWQRTFKESYPYIPINVVCFMNTSPGFLTLFDLV